MEITVKSKEIQALTEPLGVRAASPKVFIIEFYILNGQRLHYRSFVLDITIPRLGTANGVNKNDPLYFLSEH